MNNGDAEMVGKKQTTRGNYSNEDRTGALQGDDPGKRSRRQVFWYAILTHFLQILNEATLMQQYLSGELTLLQ